MPTAKYPTASNQTTAINRQSGRLLTVERSQVLDDATRRRRIRKQLEALEQDNFHEDPHAQLQWHKKIPKFEDTDDQHKRSADDGSNETTAASSKRKRKIRSELSKQRFRKNFQTLLEEEQQLIKGADQPSYFSAQAIPSRIYSIRHFCAACGLSSNYTCIRCGARYCSIPCRDVHDHTRCLKWTT